MSNYYDTHMDYPDDPYCVWRNSNGKGCDPKSKEECDRCLAEVYGKRKEESEDKE